MGKRAGGNCPPHFEKLREGGKIVVHPFLALNLRRKQNCFTNC